MKKLLLTLLLLCPVALFSQQINLANPSQVKGVLPVNHGGNGTASPSLLPGTCINVTGSWPLQTITNTCPGIPYPGSGVPISNGTGWGTSLQVGIGPNNLVQLTSTSALPAVSAANLTNFPILNQPTTGNAATASNLSGTPLLPNGVTAATQLTADSSGLLATTSFVHAVAASVVAGVSSINGQTGAVTISSAMIPNNSANTSGTAANLSGAPTLPVGTILPGYVPNSITINTHPLTSNVVINAADLAVGALPNGITINGYVTVGTTVNGHPLNTNVNISASDLNTGTLPHAQLPLFLSGDIPNNAANTSGNAATASNLQNTAILPSGVTGYTVSDPSDNSKFLSTNEFVQNVVNTIFSTSHFYPSDAIQTFDVGSNTSAMIINSVSSFPCCTLQPGSVGMIQSALSNGGMHMWYYDGNDWDVLITNNDSTCDLQGCTGTGLAVNQNQPKLNKPDIGDAVGTSMTLALPTGDLFDLKAGSGFVITGSLTSGAFVAGENVIQGTTGASAVLVGAPAGGSSPMIITGALLGTPDNSHTWIGQTSGAIYTPTAIPATPFIVATPQASHVKMGYGANGHLQVSYGTDAFMDAARTVNSGTATMTTGAITAGNCGTTVTVAATNTLATDAITFSFNAAVTNNPGVLKVNSWPTANNVNFQYCNPTAGSVTPTAATLNWRVAR